MRLGGKRARRGRRLAVPGVVVVGLAGIVLGGGLSAQALAIEPDVAGPWVAFREPYESSPRADVWLFNVETGQYRRLHQPDQNAQDVVVTLSRVVWTALDADAHWHLWNYDLDSGTTSHVLASNGMIQLGSSESEVIATVPSRRFCLLGAPCDPAIYVAAGSGDFGQVPPVEPEQDITPDKGQCLQSPDIDGQWRVWEDDSPTAAGCGSHRPTYALRAGLSSALTPLGNGEGVSYTHPISGGRIAFVDMASSPRRLILRDLGGEADQLAVPPTEPTGFVPDFRDGKVLFVAPDPTAQDTPRLAPFSYDVSSGQVTQLFNEAAEPEKTNGARRSGDVLVYRALFTDGIYARNLQTGQRRRIWPPAPDDSAGTKYLAVGDSVASGEGLNWGWRHERSGDPRSLLSEWSRDGSPHDAPVWEPSADRSPAVQACHRSDQAYPVVAAGLSGIPDERVWHRACTGSTVSNGLLGPRHFSGEDDGLVGPPQLAASPGQPYGLLDLVRPTLLTLTVGANDVRFRDIVERCYLKPVSLISDPCNRDPGLKASLTYFLSEQAENLDALLSYIAQHYQQWGEGPRPRVLVTNYYDPFNEEDQTCPDVRPLDFVAFGAWIDPHEVNFLKLQLRQLNDNIARIVRRHEGIASLVDISGVMNGHQWCSSDPWVFGPSLMAHQAVRRSGAFGWEFAPYLDSAAPFHPTAAGQAAIAREVSGTIGGMRTVAAGADVYAPLGDDAAVTFETVTAPGIVSVARGTTADTPPANSFAPSVQFDLTTTATYEGSVSVTVPAGPGEELFHAVDGTWHQVSGPADHDGGVVTATVSSLSPFAIGQPVPKVTADLAGPANLAPGEVGVFDAGSSDVAGSASTISYRWFVDGAEIQSNAAQVSHAFSTPGDHRVEVRVQSSDGAVDTASWPVTVVAAAPVIRLHAPTSAARGEPVRLQAAASTYDGTAPQLIWSVDGELVPGADAQLVRTFNTVGVHQVQAIAVDRFGTRQGAEATVRVNTDPGSPSAESQRPPSRPAAPCRLSRASVHPASKPRRLRVRVHAVCGAGALTIRIVDPRRKRTVVQRTVRVHRTQRIEVRLSIPASLARQARRGYRVDFRFTARDGRAAVKQVRVKIKFG